MEKIYPQGRSLVSIKKRIRLASGEELVKILDSVEFIQILLGEWRSKVKNDAELDRILDPKKLENIFPGGMEALAAMKIQSPGDFSAISTAIDKIPFSGYTQYWLRGLAGGWENGPHPNTPVLRAAELITSSAEFIAGIRLVWGNLTEEELNAVGHGPDPGRNFSFNPHVITDSINKLVGFWKKKHRGKKQGDR